MIEGKMLFTGRDQGGEALNRHLLAQMVAFMAMPPATFLERRKTAPQLFGDGGVKELVQEYLETALEAQSRMRNNVVGKGGSYAFMRKMLQWDPEERATAKQLLQDAWLNG